MKSYLFIGVLAVGLWCAGSAHAVPVPVDLSTWTVEQYEQNFQPDASWGLSNGNTVATQSVNADASILLSDFNIASTSIEGSWRVNTSGDDDFMGFVFGYQGRGQFYLFDWKQTDQTHRGFADAGMSVKAVNIPGGADATDFDFWQTDGRPDVTLLEHNTIPWADFTDYDFKLTFFPGVFQIEVRQGNTLLESWTINDNTFTDGQFGFYNYSQNNVVYQGFTQEDDPEPIGGNNTGIPEPITATLGLMGLGVLGMATRRRVA